MADLELDGDRPCGGERALQHGLALRTDLREDDRLDGQLGRRIERPVPEQPQLEPVAPEAEPGRLGPDDPLASGAGQRRGTAVVWGERAWESAGLCVQRQGHLDGRLPGVAVNLRLLGRKALGAGCHAQCFPGAVEEDLRAPERTQRAALGPHAGAALQGRAAEGDVLVRVGRAVDLHFVQVEEDRRLAGDLDADEAGFELLVEGHLQRLAARGAAEVSALVVVTLRPGLGVVGGEDPQVVGVVDARLVVQPVVDHDPRDPLPGAEVDLPPGVRLLRGVEGIAAVPDAVDRAARVQGRGGGVEVGLGVGGELRGHVETPVVVTQPQHGHHRMVGRAGRGLEGSLPAGVLQAPVDRGRSPLGHLKPGDLPSSRDPRPLNLPAREANGARPADFVQAALVLLAPVVFDLRSQQIVGKCVCGNDQQQRGDRAAAGERPSKRSHPSQA